jgi:DNA polymerase-3 subunit epsilon
VLVNPETPFPFITGLTGIDDAMLSSAPTFAQLAPALLERLRGRLLIAHNARFDYGFLKVRVRAARGRFPGTQPVHGQALAQAVPRAPPAQPRYPGDAPWPQRWRRASPGAGRRARALGFVAVLASPTAGATIRSAVAAIVGRPELPPQIDAALIDDLPEAAGAYAFYGEDGRLLLRRRSSNLRQQVLAHFTPPSATNALLRDLRRIEWREAAGEFGARLREIELARSLARRAPSGATRAWGLQRSGAHAARR